MAGKGGDVFSPWLVVVGSRMFAKLPRDKGKEKGI
jgi:hypothetical protein